MNRQYLDPKQPLDIEPDADRNVERITDCCLDVRSKSSYLFGRGRGGGAWWMIWMGMMLIILGAFTSFFDGNIRTGIPAFLGISAIGIVGFGLSLLWPIHIWKTHLPLRFNRQTRKVYFYWKGKTYIEEWDEIKVSLKAQFGVNAMGAPIRDPHVNVEFHSDDGSTFTVILMGVERMGFPPEHRAAAFWEFIRQYMEEGPKDLPEPDLGAWRPLDLKGLYLDNTPFPIIKLKTKWLWPLDIALLFPLRVIWFCISYPTELIYFFVEKRVKVNSFPLEMEEACRCDEAVKVWYPKQSAERAA